MKISDINNKYIIIKIKKLLEFKDIKASEIEIDKQNKCSYIHFGVPFFSDEDINVMYTSNSFVNDEIDDINNNKIIEIFGINPDSIIKGPIEYKEIEEIYNYFGGPTKREIFNNNENVFFYFDDKIKLYILNKH
jgi:hypothetical protein